MKVYLSVELSIPDRSMIPGAVRQMERLLVALDCQVKHVTEESLEDQLQIERFGRGYDGT